MEGDPVTPFEQAAADIASRFAHGHDELVTGCALCNAEYDAVVALSHEHCECPSCPDKEGPE
jgi:hypothetical protein